MESWSGTRFARGASYGLSASHEHVVWLAEKSGTCQPDWTMCCIAGNNHRGFDSLNASPGSMNDWGWQKAEKHRRRIEGSMCTQLN
ncbi:hypothetical protein NYO67_7822 [Aspergillus flavus]|nr:hypothetical protein NYO67_7822 [Aspergillus flavus]